MPARRKKARPPRTPKLRVPLPRQTGGRHEDKTRRSFRQRKHRKQTRDDES